MESKRRQLSLILTGMLLVLAALSGPAAADPVRRQGTQRFTWTVGRVRHSLQLTRTDDADHIEIVGGDGPRSESIRSVVGPMVSSYHQDDDTDGDRGRTTRHLSVRFLDGYHFDLVSYLDRSRRSGEVLAARSRQARCADAEQVASDRRSFREIYAARSPDCFRGPDMLLDDGTLPFWIERWDPSEGVTLVVQTARCSDSPSSCDLETTQLVVPAPPEWIPWLEAAQQRNGLLGEARGRLTSTGARREALWPPAVRGRAHGGSADRPRGR